MRYAIVAQVTSYIRHAQDDTQLRIGQNHTDEKVHPLKSRMPPYPLPIDYIHNNPVKRGLCQRAAAWSWSSARYYLLEPPKQQFDELPFIHGIPPGAFDKAQPR